MEVDIQKERVVQRKKKEKEIKKKSTIWSIVFCGNRLLSLHRTETNISKAVKGKSNDIADEIGNLYLLFRNHLKVTL